MFNIPFTARRVLFNPWAAGGCRRGRHIFVGPKRRKVIAFGTGVVTPASFFIHDEAIKAIWLLEL
jgi:hypothetical protein